MSPEIFSKEVVTGDCWGGKLAAVDLAIFASTVVHLVASGRRHGIKCMYLYDKA